MKIISSKWKPFLAAFILLPLMIGTSPIVIQHRYIIKGFISRPEGRAKSNFVLNLRGKFVSNRPAPEEYDFTGSSGPIPNSYIQCITDSSGMFYLDVITTMKADSIAIKVNSVDKPAVFSKYFSISEAAVSEIESRYSDPVEPGCSGCSANPEYKTYIGAYIYSFPDQTVPLPY